MNSESCSIGTKRLEFRSNRWENNGYKLTVEVKAYFEQVYEINYSEVEPKIFRNVLDEIQLKNHLF